MSRELQYQTSINVDHNLTNNLKKNNKNKDKGNMKSRVKMKLLTAGSYLRVCAPV